MLLGELLRQTQSLRAWRDGLEARLEVRILAAELRLLAAEQAIWRLAMAREAPQATPQPMATAMPATAMPGSMGAAPATSTPDMQGRRPSSWRARRASPQRTWGGTMARAWATVKPGVEAAVIVYRAAPRIWHLMATLGINGLIRWMLRWLGWF